MLKKQRLQVVILEGTCDSCHKDLKIEIYPAQDKEPARYNYNFGILRPSFGYGSRFDTLEYPGDSADRHDMHLCEDCWEKMLDHMGLTKKFNKLIS